MRLQHCGLVSEGFIPLRRELSGPPCQCIRLPPLLAGLVRNLEVESEQELGPSGLSAVEELECHEVLQVLVV